MWELIVKMYCFYNVIKSLLCMVMRKTALLNPNSRYLEGIVLRFSMVVLASLLNWVLGIKQQQGFVTLLLFY
jgi:hypothetical protein